MNATAPAPETTPEPVSGEAVIVPAPVINPNLSAEIRAECGAIQKDLQEAESLAATFEERMAAKSKEILHLKRLVEQTRAHLSRLQEGITAMRQERHKLANEVMRAAGLELQLKKMTAERDQIAAERDRARVELDGVLQALADENAAKSVLRFDKRDVQVVELTMQVVSLKRELEEIRKNPRILFEQMENGRRPKTAAAENLPDGTDGADGVVAQ
jgi:chromosome segregation ATPase